MGKGINLAESKGAFSDVDKHTERRGRLSFGQLNLTSRLPLPWAKRGATVHWGGPALDPWFLAVGAVSLQVSEGYFRAERAAAEMRHGMIVIRFVLAQTVSFRGATARRTTEICIRKG